MDAHDLDYLIRTVWGEARGEPPEGQQAVANVILNRAKQGGHAIRDVVLAPAQFTPWHDPKVRTELTNLRADSPDYQRIAANIEPALEGHDATGGADHFFAPKLANPDWAQGAAGHDIGNHRFLKLGYSGTDGTGGAMPTAAELLSGGKPAAAGGLPSAAELLGGAVPLNSVPPAPGGAPVVVPQREAAVVPMKRPTIAQDATSGFIQPFQTLGHDVMQQYRDSAARPRNGSLADRAKATLDDFMAVPRVAGDVLGLGSAPVQAVIRPLARAINNNIPLTPRTGGGPTLQNGKLGWQHGHDMSRDEAQTAIEGALNSALSAARPANAAPGVPKLTPKSVDELKAVKSAAYAAVDKSGFAFKQADAKALADSIHLAVEDAGGAELNEQAAKMARRIAAVADKGDIPLSQLDKLRAQVGEKVIAKGEPTVGYAMRDQIDALIDSASVPEMRQARAANTQYMKAKEIADLLESADLAQAAAGTGGNQNAPRQKLKPLMDPKSNQRLRNLTPDEATALRKVVRGTPGQNVLRTLSAFDPWGGKLQAMLQGGAAGMTHGASLITVPVGVASTFGERAIAASNLKKLRDLISTGGVVPKPLPYAPLPVARLASPAGLVGAGVTTAPLVRIPARKEPAKKQH